MEAAVQTTPATPPSSWLARVGLLGRLLTAILLVALPALAVGIVGVQRMSVLSASAERVYSEGTVPLRELKQLQSTWWEDEAWNARSSITSAGPEDQPKTAALAADLATVL